MNHQTRWKTLLHWLWLAGLMSFGLYVSWDSGILQVMLETDQTWISFIILIIFLATSLHCAWRSYFMSRQYNALSDWQSQRRLSSSPSVINDYLQQLSGTNDAYERQTITELLAEQLRGQHQIGWFITATLLKLGLLGTVIGFVMMLASIGTLDTLEVDQVQGLMQQMTQGMGIALNTTLMGLVGSILLGIQYLFLDRSADKLIAEAARLTQSVGGNQSVELTQAPSHGAV